jgi:hypothetical protein
VHVFIIYGMPICAFYGNVTPVAASTSGISNVLVRSQAPLSALILIERDLTNSPNPAQAVQRRPKPLALKNVRRGRLCTFQENPHFWVPTLKVRPSNGTVFDDEFVRRGNTVIKPGRILDMNLARGGYCQDPRNGEDLIVRILARIVATSRHK